MVNILISFLTFVLILVSLFLVLVVLMQRANSNAGLGSAFGGGMAESTFGAETTNILVRLTKWSAALFFVLSLSLYLLYMGKTAPTQAEAEELPDIPGSTVPAEFPEVDDIPAATEPNLEDEPEVPQP